MIVDYIQRKPINHERIKELLLESEKCNIYTNNGPIKQKLEKKINDYLLLLNKLTVCVNSGTSALHLLFLHLQNKFGRQLKFCSTSFTFPSILVNNFNVDIFDIDLNTYNLDYNQHLEKYDGIIITTLFGSIPKDLDKVIDYCKKNNKIIILDNCSCPLSTFNHQNICNIGDYAILSFHHTKALGFAEGGALTCNKEEYDDINALANFGFKGNRIYNKYSSNFKLSDISAAYILQHIENYNINKHIEIQNYLINSKGKDHIFNYSNNLVYGNLPVLFKKPIEKSVFHELGIEANKYYYPLHTDHKNSWYLYNHLLNFPLHAGLTDFQVDFLIKQIKNK